MQYKISKKVIHITNNKIKIIHFFYIYLFLILSCSNKEIENTSELENSGIEKSIKKNDNKQIVQEKNNENNESTNINNELFKKFSENRPQNQYIQLAKEYSENNKFQKLINSIPELSKFHNNCQLFSPYDIYLVILRGGTKERNLEYYSFTWSPIYWYPNKTKNSKLLIGIGKKESTAFIFGLIHQNNNWKYLASYWLLNQDKPISLVFGDEIKQLYWTECWHCKGTGGEISFENNTLKINQNW